MFCFKKAIPFVVDKSVRYNRFTFTLRCFKYDYPTNKNLIIDSSYPVQIHHFLVTTNCVQNFHTIKGWKSVARDGQKEEYIPEKPPVSCEEGNNAVPHLDLINLLHDCKTVSDQINTFCSAISITSKDVENRKEFCESLVKIFSPYFPEFKINLFGSSINGLGFKGSDVDVSIQTIFDGKDYVKNIKEVPTLDSVIEGTISPDTVAHLPPRMLLRFVRRILRQHCTDVNEPIFLIKARCSLLRFYNTKYDVFCDFSCENFASLRNTKLLRLLCLIDDRFSSLAKLIRYWGKYGKFVGDIDMFNSYAFSLLVVHFLQQTNPPVLPPVKELSEKSEYLNHGDVNDDELLFKDAKLFQKSQNSQTIEELLREYFFYFLTFDYSQIMIPLSGSIMPLSNFVPDEEDTSDTFEFSPIIIQDPFRPNFNVTAGAKYKSCKRFLNGLIEACKMYQDHNAWHPGADLWGICSLFHRTVSDYGMAKKWKGNIYTIKLPLQVNATYVKEILQCGLLFDCSELNSECQQNYLSFNCKVYHITWKGRHWIHKNYPESLTNQLDIENWVSKEILKNKEDNRKVLFTFMCECFENKCDNELNVVLTFKESKYPPNVPLFLKEYIASMCKQSIV